MPEISHIAAQFDFPGAIDHVHAYGSGIINDTFVVTFSKPAPSSHPRMGKRAILQRINSQVFPQPIQVMHNLGVILQHAAQQDSSDHSGYEFLLLLFYIIYDGNSYFKD